MWMCPPHVLVKKHSQCLPIPSSPPWEPAEGPSCHILLINFVSGIWNWRLQIFVSPFGTWEVRHEVNLEKGSSCHQPQCTQRPLESQSAERRMKQEVQQQRRDWGWLPQSWPHLPLSGPITHLSCIMYSDSKRTPEILRSSVGAFLCFV